MHVKPYCEHLALSVPHNHQSQASCQLLHTLALRTIAIGLDATIAGRSSWTSHSFTVLSTEQVVNMPSTRGLQREVHTSEVSHLGHKHTAQRTRKRRQTQPFRGTSS